jgi:hypothetical protein
MTSLRTLEFWVDNLNPLFLYPEMCKHTILFSSLMQSLSRHLRPAPYPYGLLTLRLLGKLGGKNREFLREPLLLCHNYDNKRDDDPMLMVNYSFPPSAGLSTVNKEVGDGNNLQIRLPLDRCLAILKMIAIGRGSKLNLETSGSHETKIIDGTPTRVEICWEDSARLWDEKLEDVDMTQYSEAVIAKTRESQAMACMNILRAAANIYNQPANEQVRSKEFIFQRQQVLKRQLCLALLYAAMVDVTALEAKNIWYALAASSDTIPIRNSLMDILCDPSLKNAAIGVEMIHRLVDAAVHPDESIGKFMADLCKTCSSLAYAEKKTIQEAILALMLRMGQKWCRTWELELVNAAMVSVKSVPRELSGVAVQSFEFLVRVCATLYGSPWKSGTSDRKAFIFDAFAVKGDKVGSSVSEDIYDRSSRDKSGGGSTEMRFAPVDALLAGETQNTRADEMKTVGGNVSSNVETNPARNVIPPLSMRPSNEVLHLVLTDLGSPQHIARYVACDSCSITICDTFTKTSSMDCRLAARFLFQNYFIEALSKDDAAILIAENLSFIRRLLFSRSLRLIPLPHQVGAVEGLAVLMKLLPESIPLTDNQLLGFLSEVRKLCVPESFSCLLY